MQVGVFTIETSVSTFVYMELKPEISADSGAEEEEMPKQEEMEVWTENEGPSSDEEEEVPADQSLRGQCALVTAACPRKYPRELAERKAQGLMLPEDYSKEQFLANLRLIIGRHCTARVEKASCHCEPHKRFRPSQNRRERHYHVALKMSANFAHKKVGVFRGEDIVLALVFVGNRKTSVVSCSSFG